MLKNSNGLSLGWAGVLLGAVMALASACGGSGTGGGTCTPNQEVPCHCGDLEGYQVCEADGQSFSQCQCDGNGGNGGSGGGVGNGGQGAGFTQMDTCGNGIPNEPTDNCDDPTSEFYCTSDCMGGTGGTGGTTTTSNTCEGQAVFAGYVEGAVSQWGAHPQANGKTGYEAGIEICKTIGADHPCEYQEVKQAASVGELDKIPAAVTAWIHRTTPEIVGGVTYEPGPGGRCNDWVYTTNHISDGEYATFEMVGNPTYVLDNDTFYDGKDTTHTQTGQLQCGGMTRAILCCYPVCKP